MRRYPFWARAVGLIVILAVLASTVHSKDSVWIAVGIVLALAFGAGLTALVKWPAGLAFVLARPRTLIVAGVLIAVLGFACSMAIVLVAPSVSGSVVTASAYAGTGCLLVGALIAILPATIRRVQASKAELAAIKPDAAPGKGFGAIEEAAFACRSVLSAWPVYLQITGPWVVLTCGALLPLAWLANDLHHDKGRAILVLIGVAVLLIGLLYVVLPTIALAWFKWTLEGRRPKYFVALPDRTVLGLAWRLWLFLSIVGTADGLITTQAVKLAGAAEAPLASDITSWVVMIAAVAMASSFALRFPAMAVKDSAFTRTAALVQGRRMWPALPVGLILSLAPFMLLSWATQYASDPYVKSASSGSGHLTFTPPQLAQLVALMLLFFAAIASASTLLSRAYLKAKAELLTV